MHMQNVITVLKSVRPECEFADIDDFFARGMLDSFDLTMLISAIEERFNISVQGADIVPDNFRNIAAVLSLLAKYGVTV